MSPVADEVSVSATAYDPMVSSFAGIASVSVTANNATVDLDDTLSEAGTSSASVTANNATVDFAVSANAGSASVSIESFSPSFGAAGQASITVASNAPTADIEIFAVATTSVSVAANNPTVLRAISASAGHAPVSVDVEDPSVVRAKKGISSEVSVSAVSQNPRVVIRFTAGEVSVLAEGINPGADPALPEDVALSVAANKPSPGVKALVPLNA